MRLSILAGLLAAASAFCDVAVYDIDSAHSSAQFTVRHMMVTNVRGQFSNITGTVHYDAANVGASRINATIDAATVDTRNAKRDADLKAAEFFDVEKFPAITFVSKRVMPAAPGKMKLLGDLTLRGVTKEVALEVEGPAPEVKGQRGELRSGASATTRINRKDFGLTWNRVVETGGVAVSDEVLINIDLELIRRK